MAKRPIIRVGEKSNLIKGSQQGFKGRITGKQRDDILKGTYDLPVGEKMNIRVNGQILPNPIAQRTISRDYTQPADFPNQDKSINPDSPWNVDINNLRQASQRKNKLNDALYDDRAELNRIYRIRLRDEYGITEKETSPKTKKAETSKNKKDKKANSDTKKPGTKAQGKDKPKRTLSDETKAKISQSQKERWAKKKALDKGLLPNEIHESNIPEPEIEAPEIEIPEPAISETEILEPEVIWTPEAESESPKPEIEIPESEILEQEAMIPEMEEIGESEAIVDDTVNVAAIQNILDELDKNVPSLDTLKEEAELAGQKLTLEPAKQKAEDDDLLDIIAWMIATCNMNINMRNIAPQLGSDSEFRAAAHGKKKGEAKKNAGLIGGRGTGTVGNVPGGYMIPVEAIALTVRQMRQMVYELSAVQRAIKGGLSGMTVQQIYAILYRIYAWMKSVARGSRFIDSESWTDIYAVYLGIIPQVMTLASLSNSAPGTYNQPSLSTP